MLKPKPASKQLRHQISKRVPAPRQTRRPESRARASDRTHMPPSSHHPNCTTHWEPSRFVPRRHLCAGRPAADFGAALPRGWPPVWTPGCVVAPMQSLLAVDRQCRGNGGYGRQRLRASALARGSRSRLRAFEASRLSGDRARRAASGAALPPAPHPSGGVGALDCRGNAVSCRASVAVNEAVCPPGEARQPASAAR